MVLGAESPVPTPTPITPPNPTANLNPWNWRLGTVNVFNLGLLITSGVLAYKRNWKWAVVPAGILALHEARKKRWF